MVHSAHYEQAWKVLRRREWIVAAWLLGFVPFAGIMAWLLSFITRAEWPFILETAVHYPQ
jgi:hypothetical protein